METKDNNATLTRYRFRAETDEWWQMTTGREPFDNAAVRWQTILLNTETGIIFRLVRLEWDYVEFIAYRNGAAFEKLVVKAL